MGQDATLKPAGQGLPTAAERSADLAKRVSITSEHPHLISITTALGGLELYRGRMLGADESFADFASLRFPPNMLALRDLDQRDPQPKVHILAHLRYVKALSFGRQQPRIITWLRLKADRPPDDLFPDVSAITDDGETLFSSNSLITYTLRQLVARGWLRYQAGEWLAEVPGNEITWRERANAVLAFLREENRLHLYVGPGQPLPAHDDFAGVHPTQDVIPIGQLGYVRELVWHENPLAAFNTTFFLLEHDDFISHHSALGEPYNLFVSDGVIQRPPLYRRSTIYQRGDGGWAIEMFGLDDLELFPGPSSQTDVSPPCPFTLDIPAPTTAYTRHWAIPQQGRVIGFTPPAPERHEFTIVDRRVVGHKRGGGLEIPQNGFVLSFAPEALTPASVAALESGRINYRFRHPEQRAIRQGIQVGPRLLRAGQVALTKSSLADESFWPDRRLPDGSLEVGIVPTEFPDDIDRTRAGRVGLGIDAKGQLLATVIVGSETHGVKHPRLDSAGATLVELAEFMRERRAVDAVNLDGGGSSQLFFLGGSATVPGGRLGLPTVHYERMVPSAGMVAYVVQDLF